MAFIQYDKELTRDLSSSECQTALFNYLVKRSHKCVIPNLYLPDWWEADIYAITSSNYGVEIEVKVSRSDFKKDFTKQNSGIYKHDLLKSGNLPIAISKYYFACPKNLISVDEVPEYAGLYYITCYEDSLTKKQMLSCSEVKRGKIIKKNKLTDLDHFNIIKNTYYKIWNEKNKTGC